MASKPKEGQPEPKRRGRPPKTDGLTQAAMAAEMGRRFGRTFSITIIRDWIKAGAPANDIDGMERWYREKLANSPRSASASSRADLSDLQAEKLRAEIRLKQAQAQQAELRLLVDRGKALDRDSVKRAFVKHVNDAATLLGALPDQIALIITDNPDPSTMPGLRAMVKREIDKAVKGVMRILARQHSEEPEDELLDGD